MPVISLSGVFQYVGIWFPALAAWAFRLGVVATPSSKARRRVKTSLGITRTQKKLIVVGSWIPLLVILGIFFVRYAIGVARAMGMEIAQDRNLQLAVSHL